MLTNAIFVPPAPDEGCAPAGESASPSAQNEIQDTVLSRQPNPFITMLNPMFGVSFNAPVGRATNARTVPPGPTGVLNPPYFHKDSGLLPPGPGSRRLRHRKALIVQTDDLPGNVKFWSDPYLRLIAHKYDVVSVLFSEIRDDLLNFLTNLRQKLLLPLIQIGLYILLKPPQLQLSLADLTFHLGGCIRIQRGLLCLVLLLQAAEFLISLVEFLALLIHELLQLSHDLLTLFRLQQDFLAVDETHLHALSRNRSEEEQDNGEPSKPTTVKSETAHLDSPLLFLERI